MLDIALKEWAATCLALTRGTQIVLLRKGGLRDEEGRFRLESSRFWLFPTFLHQDAQLVKPEFQSLLTEARAREGEGDRFVAFHAWAEATRVWELMPGKDDVLENVAHIWTPKYLAVRRSFRPDEPILCCALRVHLMNSPHILPMQPSYLGCRSWIEIPPQPLADSRAALDDAQFAQSLSAVETVLEAGEAGESCCG